MTGTRSQDTLCASDAPTKVETVIPATAMATSMIRDRVTPWKETSPAGCAPSAAKAPYSTCLVAMPMASGTTTPNAALAARAGVTSRQRNLPKSSQPPPLTSLARNARLARRSPT